GLPMPAVGGDRPKPRRIYLQVSLAVPKVSGLLFCVHNTDCNSLVTDAQSWQKSGIMSRAISRVLFTVVMLAMVFPFKSDAAMFTNRFHFRQPQATSYRIDESEPRPAAAGARVEWLKAWPEEGHFVKLGSRVVLQLEPGVDLRGLLAERPLTWSRTVASNVFI